MQLLPPNQRAALILREVLGFSAQEVAEALEASTASVNSALQRARQTVGDKLPEESQQATLRQLGDERMRVLVTDYANAMERGDVDRVVAMLAEDAAWSMPPMCVWFRGRDLRGFLEIGPLSGAWRWKHMPVQVSGQAASAVYHWDEASGSYLPFALDVLTVGEDARITEITSFLTRSTDGEGAEYYATFPNQPLSPEGVAMFEGFGLPARLGR
jgi:RNA polymerase sigma-70 factor (ECF subfamily)